MSPFNVIRPFKVFKTIRPTHDTLSIEAYQMYADPMDQVIDLPDRNATAAEELMNLSNASNANSSKLPVAGQRSHQDIKRALKQHYISCSENTLHASSFSFPDFFSNLMGKQLSKDEMSNYTVDTESQRENQYTLSPKSDGTWCVWFAENCMTPCSLCTTYSYDCACQTWKMESEEII